MSSKNFGIFLAHARLLLEMPHDIQRQSVTLGRLEASMLGSAKIVSFVPITDPKRARKFYEGVLGLRFLSEDPFAVVMDANGTMLRLAVVQPFKPAPFTVLGWEVSGIEETVAALAKEGVKFERFAGMQQDNLGIWSAPSGAKVAWFKDPEGNVLSVSEFA
jgi:catechol 2,3-dioxygenase-like lactoylglutathione lyase family enzyme